MNGTMMLEKALILLGYTDSGGNIAIDQRIKARAITIINTVYADIYYRQNESSGEFKPLRSLNDKIYLDDKILNDVMPYGVAAYIAMSESDGDQQQIYSQMYNVRRTAAYTSKTVQDTMPFPKC